MIFCCVLPIRLADPIHAGMSEIRTMQSARVDAVNIRAQRPWVGMTEINVSTHLDEALSSSAEVRRVGKQPVRSPPSVRRLR